MRRSYSRVVRVSVRCNEIWGRDGPQLVYRLDPAPETKKASAQEVLTLFRNRYAVMKMWP